MITKYKAYRLRRKATMLTIQNRDLRAAQIDIDRAVLINRAEIEKIERQLLAIGSTLEPVKELSTRSIIAYIAVALALAFLMAAMDDAPEVAQIEADRLAALTMKAESNRLMNWSNAVVYPIAQVKVKP